MLAFERHEVTAEGEESKRPYLGFLRVPDLRVGLYRLPAAGTDPQRPHTEDEVYYVVSQRRRTQIFVTERGLAWHCAGNPKNHQIFCKHCMALGSPFSICHRGAGDRRSR